VSVKNQLEALLFSSGKAMEEEQLGTIVGKAARVVKAALQELQKDYEGRDTALRLFNEATLWKLLVKDEHLSLVRRIVADTELTRATLETLAIIAYNQPNVLQSKVVELRGGNAYEHIKELLELGFITKTKEGRSYAIRLTEKFYDYFDVEGDDSIRKVFDEVRSRANGSTSSLECPSSTPCPSPRRTVRCARTRSSSAGSKWSRRATRQSSAMRRPSSR